MGGEKSTIYKPLRPNKKCEHKISMTIIKIMDQGYCVLIDFNQSGQKGSFHISQVNGNFYFSSYILIRIYLCSVYICLQFKGNLTREHLSGITPFNMFLFKLIYYLFSIQLTLFFVIQIDHSFKVKCH